MEAVKEFMEENSESLSDDAVNFLEEDELQQALGGNLNFTLEPMDDGINFLGELPITDHFLNHLPFPPPLPPPPDTVSQVELPPPAPGCRSIATTRCHHRPVVLPRKVAQEKCRKVPAVDCFYVLKTVPDVECAPESYEDCIDVVKEIPYFEPKEECVEVPVEVCVQVEEQVPIQVCTVVDTEREPIVSTVVGTEYKTGKKGKPKPIGGRPTSSLLGR